MGLGAYLDAPMTRLFPALKMSAFADVSQLAEPQFAGQWWILVMAQASFGLNYFLGEKFLFRGVSLPKTRGVLGKFDWVANAALFGLYHLHKPWMIPRLIVGSLAITCPARRLCSNWMAIVIHGVEGIFMLVMVLAVIPKYHSQVVSSHEIKN